MCLTPVKFGDALNQKLHHPRCLRCHQFNSARQAREWVAVGVLCE